ASSTTNKDDDLEIKSSSKKAPNRSLENPANSTARGPAEREKDVELHKTHLDSTREMCCQVTDNKWIEADRKSYRQNRVADIPIDKGISAVEAVSHRAAVTINS